MIFGLEVFLLWELYGFLNDFMEFMVEENGFTFDNEGFV